MYHLTPLSIYLILASLCERPLCTPLEIVDVSPASVTILFPSLRNLRYLAQVYKAGMPCVRVTSGKCQHCIDHKLECSEFSHEHLVVSKKKTCDRCGHEVLSMAMKQHLRSCRGKCKACLEAGVPCVMTRSRKCESCEEHKLDCSGFSRKDLPDIEARVCKRRGKVLESTSSTLKAHQNKCVGKCERCLELGVPCLHRSNRDTKRAGCAQCVEDGVECSMLKPGPKPC